MINFKTISIENINELKDYKNFDKINYRNNIILSAELSYNLHVNILCIIINNEICGCIIYYIKNKKVLNFKNTFFYKEFLFKEKILKFLSNKYSNHSFVIFDQSNSKNNNEQKVVNIKLKIKDNLHEQWDFIPSKTKNMIRKGKKFKVKIIQNNKYLYDFYNIYYFNMLNKKILPHTYDFFLNLFKKYDNEIFLFVSLDEKKVTGGVVLILEKNHAHYPFHTSLMNYNKYSVNDLLIWEIIKFVQNKKINYIDFGEATINSGVYKFKNNFSKSNIIEYIDKYQLTNNRNFIYKIKDYFFTKKIFFLLYKIKFPIKLLLKNYKINNLGI